MLTRLLQVSVNALPWRLRLAIKRVPVLAPVQRWVVSHVLSRKTFVHEVNKGPAKGLRYPVVLPTDKGIWAGTYEPEFAAQLAVSVTPGSVCYDVGSYRGFMSAVLALAGGRVYAFEPLPENCRQVEAMIAANPALRITLLPVALGREAGYTQFHVMAEASMGKLADSEFRPDDAGVTVANVRVSAVDELVDTGQVPPPNVMKIDVEGAETLVLAGARTVLAKYRPTLFIEVHSRSLALQCRDELARYGYRIRVLETGREPRPDRDPEVSHFVCTAA